MLNDDGNDDVDDRLLNGQRRTWVKMLNRLTDPVEGMRHEA